MAVTGDGARAAQDVSHLMRQQKTVSRATPAATPSAIRRRARAELREAWGELPTPQTEAKAFLRMVGRHGDTAGSLRELIGVPPRIEAMLRHFIC